MKKIRIKICDYDPEDEASYAFTMLRVLRKHYEVEFSEQPDYVFYNEATFEYLNYDCIRIYYTCENIHPNFNLCDYAIAFDYMNFGDRYYRLPFYLVTLFLRQGEIDQARNLAFAEQLSFTREDLAKKTEFCSFVYSNYLGDDARKTFFYKLSEYKKVNAGGSYLNNVGGRVPNKLEFELKHKFSIAFENSSREGYTTEKLANALLAKTIPIYWGNPAIGKGFNESRVINCGAYQNFDQVIERVREIDTDDDLYLKIINAPVAAQEYDYESVLEGFENFIRHIIDQPLEAARRRHINPVRRAKMEENERIIEKHEYQKNRKRNLMAKIYAPLKKFKSIEKLKQRILRKKAAKRK